MDYWGNLESLMVFITFKIAVCFMTLMKKVSFVNADVLTHPRILALLEQKLLPNFLVTAYQAILIQPNESPQPLHFDDEFCWLPRPRAALSYATIWAIDEFTKANGGTVVIPGSHRWGDRKPVAADMKNAIQVVCSCQTCHQFCALRVKV